MKVKVNHQQAPETVRICTLKRGQFFYHNGILCQYLSHERGMPTHCQALVWQDREWDIEVPEHMPELSIHESSMVVPVRAIELTVV